MTHAVLEVDHSYHEDIFEQLADDGTEVEEVDEKIEIGANYFLSSY